uniref:Phosphatidate cytidylyltransferase n=1 Tax=Octactis speculum TaxID=3111310 RepID=A0A7S2AJI9_9STRA
MKSSETKLRKFLTRSAAAVAMVAALSGVVIFGGALGVSVMLIFITFAIFRELVAVGYSEANGKKKLPWYRSLQWAWFFTSLCAAYISDFFKAPMFLNDYFGDIIPSYLSIVSLHKFSHYKYLILLLMYAFCLMGTVLSLRNGHISVQLHILSFTVLALSIFVIPLKMAIFNVFTGIFWFVFPLLLVAVNDTFAYLFGMSLGRRLIKGTFLRISPNKTWEGFLGGGAATLLAGWYLPLWLGSMSWLTCSYLDLKKFGPENCQPMELFWGCSSSGGAVEVQYHGLFLAFMASTIAPFGGFFASAIKRAYGYKDFASFIPGHGGFMDRLDCQILMALCTWVHLKTFVVGQSPVDQVMNSLYSMDANERDAVLENLLSMKSWKS